MDTEKTFGLREFFRHIAWSDWMMDNFGVVPLVHDPEDFFRSMYHSSDSALVPFRLYGLPSSQCYLVRNPEFAYEILNDTERFSIFKLPMLRLRGLLGRNILTTEGQEWKQHREPIEAALKKIKDFQPAMRRVIQEKVDNLHERYTKQGNLIVDIGKEMSDLTIRVLAVCLLGDQVTEEDMKNISEGSVDGLAAIFPQLLLPIIIPHFIPTKTNERIRIAREKLIKVSGRLIKYYENNKSAYPNLITKLLDSALDIYSIDADVRTMFIAGHETTAVSLTWLAYRLALHPNKQDEWMGENIAVGTVREELRLNPPVAITARQVMSHTSLGNFLLRPGNIVHIPILEIQRSLESWGADAHEFNPQRWQGLKVKKGTWLPFLDGPRACAGAAFAIREMTEFLTLFKSKGGRFVLPENYQKPIPKLGFTRKPQKPLYLKIQFIR